MEQQRMLIPQEIQTKLMTSSTKRLEAIDNFSLPVYKYIQETFGEGVLCWFIASLSL